MATNEAGEFEAKLARLDEIVAQLEGGAVGLEASVALFKEGREIARRCDELLKAAQEAVQSAAEGARPSAPSTGNAAPGQLPL